MKTTDANSNIINEYFNLLKNLSPDTKRELIAKLSDSINSSKIDNNGSWKHLFGAFISDKSAEELIIEIRSARTFSKNIETF